VANVENCFIKSNVTHCNRRYQELRPLRSDLHEFGSPVGIRADQPAGKLFFQIVRQIDSAIRTGVNAE
jgi:hypothetical protein